jgi:hypothetical protein
MAGRTTLMTAPERRRPLPALAFIGALCLLTALVWFRVIHRPDPASTAASSTCPSGSASARPPAPRAATVVPAPKTVSVLVLNSTQRSGIAGVAKRQLQQRGFTVTQAADDSVGFGGHGLVRGVAEIRFGPSARAAATLLSFYFPHATLKATDSSSGVVTVSLGAQYRRVAKPAAVTAALRAAHVKVGKVVATATPSPSAPC